MSKKKYLVTRTSDERGHLADLLRRGKTSAPVLTRARILLGAGQAGGGPALEDAAIADGLGVGGRTVSRVRERFVERGVEDCLRRKTQDKPSRERTLGGKAEARLIALACSDPPADRATRTMRLLADRLVGLEVVGAVSDEAVRRADEKTYAGKPGWWGARR